jgi:hypothetical protein
MSLTTFTLSQNQAEVVRANGDYHAKIAAPIQIEDGDQIRLRMASIDSQKQASNTVVINQDTAIGIVYSYWDYDYTALNKTSYNLAAGANAKYFGAQWGTPTFDYYALYAETPIVTFASGTATIVGAYASGYNQQMNVPISGTFLVNKALMAQRKISLPDLYDFVVTAQYIDPDGEYKQVKLTGTNATYGVVPGAPAGTPAVYYATSNVVTLTPVDGNQFQYQKGTMKAISVQGAYPATYGPSKRYNQNIIETESGSQAPSRGGQAHEIRIGNPTVVVQLVEFIFDFLYNNADAAGTLQLKLRTQNAVLKAGTYDPASLAVQVTQLFNNVGDLVAQGAATDPGPLEGENQFMTITTIGDNPYSLLRRLNFGQNVANIAFNIGDTYQYLVDNAPDPGSSWVPTYVGASKFVMQYGAPEGEVFAISYMHMPLESGQTGAPANIPQEAVAYIAIRTGQNYQNNPVVHWNPVTAASGIAIHQLEPVDFWQNTLGLYDQLIVPLYNTTAPDANLPTNQYYLKSDLVRKVTTGFDSRQGLLPASGKDDNWRSATITAANLAYKWVDTEGATKAIIGDTVQTQTTGYYLIEIGGLTRRSDGFMDSAESNPSIQAIVSSQFDSNNRVTGFGDSALSYVHQGAGYLLSDLRVRILDPDSKLVAADIGSENSIIIDVIKNQTLPQAPTPPVLTSGRV